MNRMLRDTVLGHAKKVRSWAEVTNKRRKYPHSSDLNGWCAIASAKLHRELAEVGIVSELHMAQGDWGCHVFLVIEDHVVDVTATQFGGEFLRQPIVIAHHKELEHHWFYQSCDVFPTAEELREHQIRTGWPENQTAHK